MADNVQLNFRDILGIKPDEESFTCIATVTVESSSRTQKCENKITADDRKEASRILAEMDLVSNHQNRPQHLQQLSSLVLCKDIHNNPILPQLSQVDEIHNQWKELTKDRSIMVRRMLSRRAAENFRLRRMKDTLDSLKAAVDEHKEEPRRNSYNPISYLRSTSEEDLSIVVPKPESLFVAESKHNQRRNTVGNYSSRVIIGSKPSPPQSPTEEFDLQKLNPSAQKSLTKPRFPKPILIQAPDSPSSVYSPDTPGHLALKFPQRSPGLPTPLSSQLAVPSQCPSINVEVLSKKETHHLSIITSSATVPKIPAKSPRRKSMVDLRAAAAAAAATVHTSSLCPPTPPSPMSRRCSSAQDTNPEEKTRYSQEPFIPSALSTRPPSTSHSVSSISSSSCSPIHVKRNGESSQPASPVPQSPPGAIPWFLRSDYLVSPTFSPSSPNAYANSPSYSPPQSPKFLSTYPYPTLKKSPSAYMEQSASWLIPQISPSYSLSPHEQAQNHDPDHGPFSPFSLSLTLPLPFKTPSHQRRPSTSASTKHTKHHSKYNYEDISRVSFSLDVDVCSICRLARNDSVCEFCWSEDASYSTSTYGQLSGCGEKFSGRHRNDGKSTSISTGAEEGSRRGSLAGGMGKAKGALRGVKRVFARGLGRVGSLGHLGGIGPLGGMGKGRAKTWGSGNSGEKKIRGRGITF